MVTKNLITLEISNFNLPMLHIKNISPSEIKSAVQKQIQHTKNFLKYTPVIINVAKLTYESNWNELYQSILNTKLRVIGVVDCHDIKLKKIILKSGLPIIKYWNNKNTTCIQEKEITLQKQHTTQLIKTPIRSGQQIYARNSDLIIINNVGSGAEIISDGNIHVYGITRGRILAGASGNKQCQIFCTHFFPELVSIDGHYWIGDQIPKKFIGKSVRLNLQNNILVIHSL